VQGELDAPEIDVAASTSAVDRSEVRCPHVESATHAGRNRSGKGGQRFGGGIIGCVCRVPAGLGTVFGKAEPAGQAMLSIPATKGDQIGSGFAGRPQQRSGDLCRRKVD
jgi:chorismate synthase